MQETIPAGMNEEQAEELDRIRREVFSGKDREDLERKMDERLDALEDKGEVLLQRTTLTPKKIIEVVAKMVMMIVIAPNRNAKRLQKKRAIAFIKGL